MGYVNALGATSTADVVLIYLRAQKASTVVAVSDASGTMGISSGGGHLVVGSAYYKALPASVRAAYPLGAVVSSPLVPGDARRVATVGELLAAIERTLAPSAAAQAPRSGMSKATKIVIAVGVLGALYVATRKGGSR